MLFIASRYRREFDGILDGIIYGAVVGFGFAMTANMISYFGSFLLFGFAGLSNIIFVEGVLYGLNHGFYTAIFGAGTNDFITKPVDEDDLLKRLQTLVNIKRQNEALNP